MQQQLHLKGRGFSGRGVRVRDLVPSEVEENLTSAAKLLSKDASIIELKKTEWRNGVKRMLTEITDPCEDPMAEGVKWKKFTPAMADCLDDFFRPKDVQLLEHLYRDANEVVASEVDDIVGKAVPLSVD